MSRNHRIPAPSTAALLFAAARAWACIAAALAIAAVVLPGTASAGSFADYFKTTPSVCPPTANAWGDKAVVPRDTCNGLEDTTGTATVRPKWMYWDGKILRATDGTYHMFASRWPHANGMGAWVNSEIIHATSSALMGPYADQGFAFNDGPDANSPHKGHNVTASELPDGTYCLIVNEIVPFTIFTASSPAGPWTNRGRVTIDSNGVQISIPQPGDQNLASNVSFVVRHDGTFQIVQRHGIIATSSTLLGPYKIQKPTTTYPAAQAPPANLATIFPNRPKHLSTAAGAPQTPESVYVYAEDPIIWYSGGQYHVIYNYPDDRVAYHLTSRDGIHDWTDQGLAFDPREGQKIFTNSDGSVSRWYNVERPNVIMENGHVAYFTFAVSDVYKMGISGSSNNDTKVVVVPFDGVRFDEETGVGGADGGLGGRDGGGDGSGGIGGAGGTGGATGAGGAGGATGGGAGGTIGAGGTGGARDGGRDLGADGAALDTGGRGGKGGMGSGGMSVTGGTNASGGTGRGGMSASGGMVSGGTAGSGGVTGSGGSAAAGGSVVSSGSSAGSGAAGGGGSATRGSGGQGGSATGRDPAAASGCSCAIGGADKARQGLGDLLLFLWAVLCCGRRIRARLAA